MEEAMEGKVVIVTGAGSGIGRAASLLFAEKGARVAVVDLDPVSGAETVAEIEGRKKEAIFIEADVSKTDQVQAMVRRAVEAFGRLDHAFNNAGVEGGLFPLDQYAEVTWERTLSINLTGVWLCMKYEIPEMLKTGGGAVVNAASAAGVIGVPNHYAYVASKHGVVGITKSAALEFGAQGIRVNCVCPGIIDTPMTDRFVPAAARPLFEDGHALKRFGTAQEVAECAVWLCSDAASFVTGHALLVDGGITAQ
jgi:NAD(P)-dependent dehydrogenase (short-subunit alcohol dehydrogenase family)